MLKVVGEINREIDVHDMQDGDIGVITHWFYQSYKGRVVQRYKNLLITLGAYSGLSFGDFFAGPQDKDDTCRVRLLPKGTTFVLD